MIAYYLRMNAVRLLKRCTFIVYNRYIVLGLRSRDCFSNPGFEIIVLNYFVCPFVCLILLEFSYIRQTKRDLQTKILEHRNQQLKKSAF